MSDLIATWRRNLRVVRLDTDQSPQIVDVEPLEVFSVFGRAGDRIMSHLKLGDDAIIATDANASGALAIPTDDYPTNQLATGLLNEAGLDLQNFAIVGAAFIVGVDSEGKLQDAPQHVIESLSRSGNPVKTQARNTP